MSAQTIYSELKNGDNKQLWAFANELSEFRRKKETVKDASTVNLDDKEGLRQEVLEHLYQESSRGNAQASDKLAKLAGLTEESADIIIETVEFSNAQWQ